MSNEHAEFKVVGTWAMKFVRVRDESLSMLNESGSLRMRIKLVHMHSKTIFMRA